MNNRRTSQGRRAVVFCVIGFFTVTLLSGCASFRKKFVRQKKKAEVAEDFVPVLRPIEYERAWSSPEDVYKGHYAMLKAYFKDLGDALVKRDGGDKREKYILHQLGERLRVMAGLLREERKDEAEALAGRIEKVLKEYDKPPMLRRYDIIRSDMKKVERDACKAFRPVAVRADLVSGR